MGDFIINYVLAGMVMYQLAHMMVMLIRNVPGNYCRKINFQLRNYHKLRYEVILFSMRPMEPRLYAKYKWRVNQRSGFPSTHSYELTRRQEWSCFFRALTLRDRYASFTDTQRWMLGVKEPYFPKNFFSRVYLSRVPWKIYAASVSGKPLAVHLLAGDLRDSWSHHTISKTYWTTL